MEQVGLLGYVSNQACQRRQADVSDVDVVDPHGPLRDVVKARNQVGDCRLPSPAGAHQRNELSGLHIDTYSVQRQESIPFALAVRTPIGG